MALAFFKSKDKDSLVSKISEKSLGEIGFTVHKLNHRPRPRKKDRIKIIGCFSEFGCETIGAMYCIPRLLRRFPGSYVIVMGWHGREYLYRHLVDEFWEMKEEHMWLRDHARAFHHISSNLERLERAATKYGDVIPSSALGKYAVCNYCKTCGKFWHEWRKKAEDCPLCHSTMLVRSSFTDIENHKKTARMIPKPSEEMMDWAKSVLKPNSVGIFARGRKTYGRNLQPEFYVKLIALLEEMGHNVVWLGEKQNVLPCPVDHVFDFSQMDEARDLERTLALIANLDFTVQFWTASTRLAGMMGTPFLLFESPEQVYVSYSGLMSAQEGKRLELSTFGPKKVVLAHYRQVLHNNDEALRLVRRSVEEMQQNNFEEIIGMVENEEFTKQLQAEHYEMLT